MSVLRSLERARLPLAQILVLSCLALSAMATRAGEPAPLEAADAMPLSPNIAAIPDFRPIAMAKPYRLAWQIELLAQQHEYVTQILASESTIDPVQTGSITY